MSKKISKKLAKKWASKFKSKHPDQASSVMYSKGSVMNILNQPGCEGLRIYNAFNENDPETGKGYTMFLVGTDASGTNLLPTNEDSTTEQYSIEDDGRPCPPYCPANDL